MTATRSVVTTAAAVLLAAGCSTPEHGPGHPAATSPVPPSAVSEIPEPESAATLLPGIPDSAELSEPVVARGRVVRADGAVVPDALVTLTTRLNPVAAARSGPDGQYELRIAAHLRAELATNENGQVEFAVSAESAEGDGRLPVWTAPAEPTHPYTADIEVTE
ncbi:carboxypeptidase regulatory-like domain-containing protein [Jiangella ureilytica]|uniref:Carboxypeptidase regulatory-like domain-containing protein n=1 Tax=Jiangella ureilytica TaxID=2530374 RepID=A0A4R4RP85_9ACTN|nr:carboxypeptidase-like regulatory domain-containing protein [Jiangella ureilytica]TDC50949.1 carboxypeptidase regulatory-like domain-containing protein [Jiangella ureilytica]